MVNLDFTTTETLSFSQSKGKIQKKSKVLAINQLIKIYEINKTKKIQEDARLQHGFELEVFITKKDNETGSYFLYPDTQYLYKTPYNTELIEMKPEAMSPQIEMVPRNPFKSFLCGKAMKDTFSYISSKIPEFLGEGEELLLQTHFNGFGDAYYNKYYGIGDMSFEEIKENNKITRSRTFIDSIIAEHPLYLTGLLSFSERPGDIIRTELELFKDEKTDSANKTNEIDTKEGFITHEGTTTCLSVNSLQITFSSRDLREARWQYDQLHILGSILVNNHFKLLLRWHAPQVPPYQRTGY